MRYLRSGSGVLFVLGMVTACDPPRPNVATNVTSPASSSSAGPKLPRRPVALSAEGRITIGDGHACWLDASDKPWCWGNNEHGQLGDGTEEHRSVPTPVLGVERASAIVARGMGTCAIVPNRDLLCWGIVRNVSQSKLPTVMAGFTDVRSVAFGYQHLCAALGSGEVRCSGANQSGQLGLGHNRPMLDSAIAVELSNAKQVTVQPGGACSLSHTGEVLCWGMDRSRKAPALSPTVIRGLPTMASITSGQTDYCGLSEQGEVYCWGSSKHDPDEARREEGWPRLARLALGSQHRCGLTSQHTLLCTGPSVMGEIGELLATTTPLEVKTFGELQSNAVLAAGGRQTCILESHGLRCVGSNDRGQLGIGESGWIAEPREIPGIQNIAAVMPSSGATCALSTSGRVSCWGLGRSESLTLPGVEARTDARTPQEVKGIVDATQLLRGARDGQVCVTKKAGDLVCFQAGLFRYPSALAKEGRDYLPTRILGVKNVVATTKPAGANRLYAVLANGKVVTLSIDERSVRAAGAELVADAEVTPILGVEDVTRVVLQGNFVCGLKTDQTVVCWKEESNPPRDGALPTPTHPRTFVVAGLPSVVDLNAWNGFYALASSGALFRWQMPQGSNPFAGFTASPTALLDVKTLGHGTALCVVRASGGVDCDRDRMGRSNRPGADNPTPNHFDVGGVSAVENYGHTCVVRADKRVACWGPNRAGGMGISDRDRSAEAVSVLLPRSA